VDEERLTFLKELEGGLGYSFQDSGWLEKALTHKSFAHQSGTPPADPAERAANEVLEFLGDAVLTLAVSHLLVQTFPDAHEGTLSLRRSHLVRRSTLASLAKEFRLEEYLLLGKGELLNGGRKKSSILANAYEALIGAVYMDGGFDCALGMVKHHLKGHLESTLPWEEAALLFNDYKSLLQERAQRVYKASPKYQVLTESGPDHDKRFQASVVIAGEPRGIGWGRSKKEAEQEAAKTALENLTPEAQRLNDKGQSSDELPMDAHGDSGDTRDPDSGS